MEGRVKNPSNTEQIGLTAKQAEELLTRDGPNTIGQEQKRKGIP